MRNSKQIGKILFLWLLFTWFRATADRWVFTKFPTCVIDTFCVWLKMGKKWLLVRCVKLRKATVSFVMSVRLCTWTEYHETWNLNIFRTVSKIQVSRKSDNKNSCLTWRMADIFYYFSFDFSFLKNISWKVCRENQTHVLWQKCISSENRDI